MTNLGIWSPFWGS